MEDISGHFKLESAVLASVTGIPIEEFERINEYVDVCSGSESPYRCLIVKSKIAQQLLSTYGWRTFLFDTLIIDEGTLIVMSSTRS